MLAKRIIPVLLARDGNLVKGKQFDSRRVVGNALQAARVHAARGVDELIVLDVGATPAGRGPDIEWMRKLTEDCFIPVTVGGGISRVDQVRELLANGADKVVIGTAAVENPGLIAQCASKFGSQAIVVAVDFVPVMLGEKVLFYGTISHCGKKPVLRGAVAFATLMDAFGAGELIVTDISREGMMNGYNLRATKDISEAVKIPVIAHGGCGDYSHMSQALDVGANAVAAGSLYQFTDATPKGAALYLENEGWEVRLWK